MKLHQLHQITKSKKHKRVGRGISAGGGKTCGRGTKGQKSRRGFNIPQRFEGGQTPFIQRIPKKIGFKSLSLKPIIIKTSIIEKKFSSGDSVNPKTLIEKNIVKNLPRQQKIKILFDKALDKKIKINDCLISKKASKYF